MSKILGVRIDDVNRKEAISKVADFLHSGQHTIFTPNPEMLVKATRDPFFKQVLNSGSLNICDGAGLMLAARTRGARVERITGVDFMLDVCKISADNKKSVYLLGSMNDEVVEKTAVKLKELFPNLIIAGYDKGPENIEDPLVEQKTYSTDIKKVVEKINAVKPDVLFVAFGMGKQEKWLYQYMDQMPSVRVGMGIGGAFDFVSGKVPRAPLLLRKFGLEWAYRLWKQPSRIGRIFNATIRFSFLFLFNYENTEKG